MEDFIRNFSNPRHTQILQLCTRIISNLTQQTQKTATCSRPAT